MPNWFDFKGVRSTAMGVRVVEYPPLSLGAERATPQTIPGSSGSLTLLEGENVLDDVVLTIQCYIEDGSDIDQFSAWLRGTGELILGNMPDRRYDARVTNQLDLATLIRNTGYRGFSVIMRCHPYRYYHPALAALALTASPGSINNFGTAGAEPVITVTGSGDVEITVGARTIAIDDLASQIVIDCGAGRAVNGDEDLTGKVTFDGGFPWQIPPGVSAVSWTGDVTGIRISRPWRYV